MSLKFLANTVWRDAAELRVTDTSDVKTTDDDKLLNVTGGGRHLSWSQSGTAGRRIVYINKTNTMACDTVVLPRADRYNGHSVTVKSWATYTASSNDEFTTSNFAETLVGIRSQDYVKDLGSLTSKQAFGVEITDGSGGAFAKTITGVYFCQSVSLGTDESYIVEPAWMPVVLGRSNWLAEQRIVVTFRNVTRSQLESFQELPKLKTDAMFLWDEDGILIPKKLLHVLVGRVNVVAEYDNFNTVTVEMHHLRTYA